MGRPLRRDRGDAPPPLARTYTKGHAFDYQDDNDKQVADTITIEDGYQGASVSLTVTTIIPTAMSGPRWV